MKQLDLNKIEDLTRLRGELDKVISERIKECEKKTLIEKISSLSFSKLKKIFEHVAPSLVNSKDGVKLTRKYVKLMKENKSLKTACAFHRLINENHSFKNSDMLLNESLSLVKAGNNVDGLQQATQKMGDIVTECVNVLGVDLDTLNSLINETNTVTESADYLLLNEKTIGNIDEYLNNFSTVSNYISNNVVTESSTNEGGITVDEAVNELVENTNSLSESWEKGLMEDITLMYLSNGNESDLFDKYINECMTTINSIMDNEDDITTKVHMSQMKEQLSNKTYNKESFSVDIKNLAELKYTLKDTIN